MKEKNITLKDLERDYIEYLESLNYSGSTVRIIYYNVLAFLNWLERHSNTAVPCELRKNHLFAWQKHLAARRTEKGMPLKSRTINKKIETVKGFLKYLSVNGYIMRSLCDVVKYVKEPQMLPMGVLNNRQMKKLLSRIDTSSAEGVRDRTLLELMYSSGLRAGEIVKLTPESIDFENGTARVLGKGRKERVVPVGKTALRYLETYIKAVRSFMLKKGQKRALFINHDGGELSYHVLLRIVHSCAAKAKLKEHVSPHTFRRSCTTELVREGANLYHVKEMLGHESLQTLKHYTKLTINDLRKTHAKCHPREKNG
jgi:integrase/recombinase XerD